jgi:YHS domain-containing protein
METCPVCGEELYEGREEQIVTLYQGKNYHFCSTEHREEFEEQPGEYR